MHYAQFTIKIFPVQNQQFYILDITYAPNTGAVFYYWMDVHGEKEYHKLWRATHSGFEEAIGKTISFVCEGADVVVDF